MSGPQEQSKHKVLPVTKAVAVFLFAVEQVQIQGTALVRNVEGGVAFCVPLDTLFERKVGIQLFDNATGHLVRDIPWLQGILTMSLGQLLSGFFHNGPRALFEAVENFKQTDLEKLKNYVNECFSHHQNCRTHRRFLCLTLPNPSALKHL